MVTTETEARTVAKRAVCILLWILQGGECSAEFLKEIRAVNAQSCEWAPQNRWAVTKGGLSHLATEENKHHTCVFGLLWFFANAKWRPVYSGYVQRRLRFVYTEVWVFICDADIVVIQCSFPWYNSTRGSKYHRRRRKYRDARFAKVKCEISRIRHIWQISQKHSSF